MHFLRNPIPQSFWEESRAEGKDDPVLDSTTGAALSAKLREPQRGKEWWEEKSELMAFLSRSEEEMETKAAVAPAAAAAAAASVEKGRGGWGGGCGREDKKGKRRDTMFVSLLSMCSFVSVNYSKMLCVLSGFFGHLIHVAAVRNTHYLVCWFGDSHKPYTHIIVWVWNSLHSTEIYNLFHVWGIGMCDLEFQCPKRTSELKIKHNLWLILNVGSSSLYAIFV